MGAYRAVLEPGAKVLGMNLSHGGHLTHGHPLKMCIRDSRSNSHEEDFNCFSCSCYYSSWR